MDQVVLQGSYWPADESRNVQNVSIGEALAQAAKAVPIALHWWKSFHRPWDRL
jgi:hypothetical protein